MTKRKTDRHEPPKPPKVVNPSQSRFGFNTGKAPIDPLTAVLRQGSRSSGRKITLVRISPGKSDEQF